MPDLAVHLRLARNNEDFCQYLLSSNAYLDWAVTGLFYSAVHYIEAYLATKRIHPISHPGRYKEINLDTNLSRIYTQFSDLKNDSTQTRYEGYTFPRTEIDSRILPTFNTLKSHIQTLLP